MKFRFVLAAAAAAAALLFVSCNNTPVDEEEEDDDEPGLVDTSAIQIDGDFADWEGLEGVAEATLPKGDVAFEAMRVFKAYADPDYIFLYFEMDKSDLATMDLFIDTDNSKATGQTANWPEMGAEVLLQASFNPSQSIGASTYNPIVRLYGGEEGGTEWAWVDEAGMNFTTSSAAVDKGGNVIAVELKMIRELMVPVVFGDSFTIGAIIENAGWSIVGKLPAITEDEKAEGTQEAGLVVRVSPKA